jgi:hypothetical protein
MPKTEATPLTDYDVNTEDACTEAAGHLDAALHLLKAANEHGDETGFVHGNALRIIEQVQRDLRSSVAHAVTAREKAAGGR